MAKKSAGPKRRFKDRLLVAAGIHPDTVDAMIINREQREREVIKMNKIDDYVCGEGDANVKTEVIEARNAFVKLNNFLIESGWSEIDPCTGISVPGTSLVLTNVDFHSAKRGLGNMLNRLSKNAEVVLKAKKTVAMSEKMVKEAVTSKTIAVDHADSIEESTRKEFTDTIYKLRGEVHKLTREKKALQKRLQMADLGNKLTDFGDRTLVDA